MSTKNFVSNRENGTECFSMTARRNAHNNFFCLLLKIPLKHFFSFSPNQFIPKNFFPSEVRWTLSTETLFYKDDSRVDLITLLNSSLMLMLINGMLLNITTSKNIHSDAILSLSLFTN